MTVVEMDPQVEQPVPTSMVERMTLILDLFVTREQVRTLEQISRRTGLPRSSAHRILELVLGVTRTPAMERAGLDLDLPGLTVSDPADVAREGLERLPHGPVHVVRAHEALLPSRLSPDRARVVSTTDRFLRSLVPSQA